MAGRAVTLAAGPAGASAAVAAGAGGEYTA